MPRKRTGRTTDDGTRRRTNGGVTSIHVATGPQSVSPSPYLRDPRWATPARRRADVFIVDIARPNPEPSNASDDDAMLLSA
jgi:hypothetical protein